MKRITLAMLLSAMVTLVQAAEQLYTHQPAVMPKFSNNGPHNVGVRTIETVNPNALNLTDFSSLAPRTLKLEVWYPAENTNNSPASYKNVTRLHKPFNVAGFAYRDAPMKAKGEFPLVVLSHGYTGYRTIMYYLGEHLASYGYVVISIDHTDSTNADIDMKKAPTAGFVSTLINRARDQQYVLDTATDPAFFLNPILDKGKAAVIGYSMGGYGAINTIGGCYDAKPENLMALGFPEQAANAMLPLFNFCNAGKEAVDERWKAMIAFAPWGQEHNLHQKASLANLQVPSLYVSGDQDDVSGFEHGVEKLYKQTNPENSYLLVYENARHNIAPHPAPKVAYETDEDLGHYYEPTWNSEQLNRVNEHMSLVFLDCHVKKQQDKCAYLPNRVNATQVKQADGKLTKPWLGFPQRWAAGIRFHRGQ